MTHEDVRNATTCEAAPKPEDGWQEMGPEHALVRAWRRKLQGKPLKSAQKVREKIEKALDRAKGAEKEVLMMNLWAVVYLGELYRCLDRRRAVEVARGYVAKL